MSIEAWRWVSTLSLIIGVLLITCETLIDWDEERCSGRRAAMQSIMLGIAAGGILVFTWV